MSFFKSLKKPYLIAEIGVNHECSIIKAKKMIRLAKLGGADAVKFQTYKALLLASKNSPAYWDKKKEKTDSQYKLFSKYDKFENKDYRVLQKFCKTQKIDFLSTPFDEQAVDNLKNITPFFKIASADINNFPLLKSIGKTNKPVLISTGASSIKDIKQAINTLKKFGTRNFALMHCILNYPTKDSDANLNMIQDLKKKFPKTSIGYSDHTLPDKNMSSLILACILGAEILEKHFTLNKKLKGNDHYHSMDYKDIKIFRKNYQIFYKKMGLTKKKPIKSELKSIKFARRSIYSKLDITKGQRISEKNIITKRPGGGINPMNWNSILKKKAKKNIKADTKIKLEYLK